MALEELPSRSEDRGEDRGAADQALAAAAGVLAPDQSRLVAWAGPVFVLCSLVLIGWTAYLGATLPERSMSGHYGTAWTGFDIGLALALLATAASALRRSSYLALTGSSTGTLLVADAWFDSMGADNSSDLLVALAMAALVELPLAAVCFWLAKHSADVAERRIRILLRRRARA